MPAVPREQTRCPLCSAENHCGLVGGRSGCWCFDHSFDAGVLAALEKAEVQDACVCRRCAAGDVPSPCVRQCSSPPGSERCSGCRRTLDEIRRWTSMDSGEKAMVRLRLNNGAGTP